jgi:hypothetical protein
LFSVRHPESAADLVVRECRGGACWPVGLTAREEGTTPTGLAGENGLSGPYGSSLIGPHECTIPRTEEKFRIDQCAEQCIACGTIKAPQPLRLRRCQSQSRHFRVLALNSSQYVIKRLLCWHVDSPSGSLIE